MRCAIVPLLLAFGGCTTVDVLAPTDPGAINTGEFPTLVATPATANEQLPQGEADAAARSLRNDAAEALAVPAPMSVDQRIAEARDAAAGAQAAAAAPPDRSEELRRIGATHAEETIRRIEGR